MKLQKVRKTMLALLGAMAACLAAGAVLTGFSPMTGLFFVLLGAALLFAFIAYSFSSWRCPHCGEYLGWNLGEGIQFCPFCHERLDI